MNSGRAGLTVKAGELKADDLKNAEIESGVLVFSGEMNEADMKVLGEWLLKDSVRLRLTEADLSDVSGPVTVPKQMFSHCPVLKIVKLPYSVKKLESQAFAYSPQLESVTIGAVTAIDGFDCFAYCRQLRGMHFSEAESAGSFSFRNTRFCESVCFDKLSCLRSYLFMNVAIEGDLLLPAAVCCDEDVFFESSVSGKIYMPKCTVLKYGIFNKIRNAGSLWLTTEEEITLNPRTFTQSSDLRNTVLYLHQNKRKSVRGCTWGGTVWKEVRFSDD